MSVPSACTSKPARYLEQDEERKPSPDTYLQASHRRPIWPVVFTKTRTRSKQAKDPARHKKLSTENQGHYRSKDKDAVSCHQKHKNAQQIETKQTRNDADKKRTIRGATKPHIKSSENSLSVRSDRGTRKSTNAHACVPLLPPPTTLPSPHDAPSPP